MAMNRIDPDHPTSGSTVRHKLASNLRRVGGICFWAQLILAIGSLAILLFAFADPSFNINIRSGLGLLSILGALVTLAFGIYWAFRYTRLARRLELSDPEAYPKRKEVIRDLHLGINVQGLGVLFTLIATQFIVAALLVKVMSFPEGLTIYQARQLINPLDIFVIQAAIFISAAQLIGIFVAFWLLRQVDH